MESERKDWINIGIQLNESNLAEYLKLKFYNPQQTLDLTKLRSEYQQELAKQK